MSFDYDRDDARRQLVIAYRGEFLAQEVREILERIGTDGVWSYTMLYDLRAMTGRPSLDDLKQIVDARDALSRHTALRRGPVALLVTDLPMYARVCAYIALAKSVIPIEVFRTLDEAEQWLRRQGPPEPQ